MKRIIITADDYGMCNEVNIAIEKCVNYGVVSSFNVIFNMEAVKKNPNFDYNQASIGIHWCLTAGRPVSDIKLIPSLVDELGMFYKPSVFKRRFKRGLIKIEEIRIELKNQYKAFCELFGQPSYWNTHQNSSLLSYRLFKIFCKTAKELGINKTRNFQRVYIDKHLLSFKKRILEFFKRIIANLYFGLVISKKFIMPSSRLFTIDVTSKLDFDKLCDVILKSKKDCIEIVVHPSTNDNGPWFGTISKERIMEYNFFSDDTLAERFLKKGIEIINFEQI